MASLEYKSKDTKTESRETTINVNVTGTKIDDEPNVGDKVIDQPIVTSTSTTTKTTTTLTSDINADALTTTTDTTTATLTNEKNSTWLFTVKNKVEKVVKEFLPESIVFDKKIVDAFDDLDKAVKSNFNNRELHPELDWDASVRLSNDICDDEKNFIKDRKNRIRESFAKYVGVDVEEINVDDIPIIGFAGSGGGFRAMIATTGYLRALQDSGLYDCGMYLAGVSGSCWNLALQYTSMISTQENPIEALLERFRTNLTNHIASARGLLSVLKDSSDPKKAAELIFGGLVQKKITDVDTGIVDTYGALLAARLLLGSDPQSQFKDFKLSEQKRFLEGGKNPLPIYTALHHARPWKDFLSKEDAALVENYEQILKEHHNQKDHYQWFEFTPFEVGCDEFEAWIPTWSFGRKFEFQKNLERIPEQNFASLIGIFGAAPCAPILIDIRQFEHFLPEGWLKREWRKCYDGTMEGLGEQKKMKFEGHHLVPASNSNNFLYHLHPPPYKLGVTNSPIMHFIDAGASNDLPLYPLTHPGRDIDIIIGFDCSSQIINHGYFEEEQRIFTERRGINSTRINADDNDIYCELYEYRPNGISGDGFTPVFKKDSCKFVYLPFLSNPKVDEKFVPSTEKFCNFANFTYTREQVDLIVRLAKQNWMDVEDKVKSTIIEIWKKKRDERLSKQQ